MFAGLFSIIIMMNAQSGELPPRDYLKLITSGNSKCLTTDPEPWHGMVYTEYISPKPIAISAKTLLNLTYALNDIPSLECKSPFDYFVSPKDKAHTRILLRDTYGGIGRSFASDEKIYHHFPGDQKKILGISAKSLNVSVIVHKKSTNEIIQEIEERRRYAQVPPEFQEEYSLPTDNKIGDKIWLTSPNVIKFVKGHTLVEVQFADRAREKLTDTQRMYLEAVAWGVLYRILQYPDISGEENASMELIHKTSKNQFGNATNVQGVAMVPAKTLKKAGATIKTTKDNDKWTMSISKGNRTVTLNAFDWYLYENGKPKRLDRPVFPYNNDLVVPLRSACDALGIKIDVSGNKVILE
jgi:hypothetical protein